MSPAIPGTSRRLRPTLLLCLDGLSAVQAIELCRRVPALGALLEKGALKPLQHSPVASFNAVWSELLWGKPWFELGAAGYARARGSLNAVSPLKESDLPDSPILCSARKTVTINLPMIEPHRPGRVWLSDGSLPYHFVVNPSHLARQAPFDNYQARPFSCLPYALSNIEQSVLHCLQVERQRLSCARELLRQADWDFCAVRLTIFDQLFHLLSPDVLFADDFLLRREIDAFLSELDLWLSETRTDTAGAAWCILSTLGHTPCIARVNLNAALAADGFATLVADRHTAVSARRKAAAVSIAGRGDEPTAPAVTPSWMFEASKSVAASVVQGGIFLNLAGRYDDGIVEADEARGLIQRIKTSIATKLHREFNEQAVVWEAENISEVGPELMIYMDGVEFHNNATDLIVDRMNKPVSTHTCEGFVWLPDESSSGSWLTPIELHHLIMKLAHG